MTLRTLFFTASFLILTFSAEAQFLPQQQVNAALSKVHRHAAFSNVQQQSGSAVASPTGVYRFMESYPFYQAKAAEIAQAAASRTAMIDTIIVGAVPNDTLVITGTFFNNGPILVVNDGVVIFQNANATILGDLFVLQDGQVWASGSTLFFPQVYFYQRTWIIVNNGYVNITDCTLDFSGLSHSLAVTNNGEINMQNVINNGFTTAGAYENASISIDSTNQAGEFIMKDNATLSFNEANTVLLWHHIPATGVVSASFPPGASVSNYAFNSSLPGVNGVSYDVQVTNSTDVMWALMPENGSDVTIDNSSIRAIGAWFVSGDTVTVSGLVNNSNYSNFTAPLSDRNLQLNNCSVQTWSIYVFDSSSIDVTGCIIGELGTMGTSQATTSNVFCDGSGGYFWASEQSFCVAIGSSVSTYVRSEKSGIMLYAYGSVIGGASALNSSVLITVQSNLPADPIPYENAIAWMVKVDQPASAFADSLVSIPGSAWIDQGPQANWMDMDRYRLWYSPAALNPPQWTAITPEVFNEVRSNELGLWDTHGLNPGTYSIRLNTFNNAGDSIEAVKQITLLPSVLGVNDHEFVAANCFPNPTKDKITITSVILTEPNARIVFRDMLGSIVSEMNGSDFYAYGSVEVHVENWPDGMYSFEISTSDKYSSGQFLVSGK